MLVRWCGILLAAALGLVAPAAGAQERITRFVSDVVVEPDGTLDVTETIEVLATGQAIRRGILRDVRTRFRNAAGWIVTARITPVEVLRDGNPEPYQSREDGNGLHLRIGVADRLLPPGPHRYLIRYRATRLIGAFADHDELYWNATGHGWTLPIDEAEARITLPEGVILGNRAFYTGRAGSRDRDAAVVEERPGELVFRTTRPLGIAEGLTVAVAWPKGVVQAPPPSLRERVGGWMPPLVAWLGSLGILAAAAWLWWGNRRWRASIEPRAEPPEGLSAAATGYLWRMGSSAHLFAAALVEAHSRDNLIIATGKGEVLEASRAKTLIKGEVEAPAGAAEGAMLGRLFERSREVEIGDAGKTALTEGRAALTQGLEVSYRRFFRLRFDRTWRFLALIAFLELAIASFVPSDAPPILILVAWLSWLAGWLGLRWRERGEPLKALILSWAAFAVGLIPTADVIVEAILTGDGLPLLLPLLLLGLVLPWLGDGPTHVGRSAYRQIEGLRRHMSEAAAGGRQEALEVFYRLAPYAMALGLGNAWSQRFADQLTGISAGSLDLLTEPNLFINDLDRSTSTRQSSSFGESSSWSSDGGSSGGGSSGDGGGGGGGSGW